MPLQNLILTLFFAGLAVYLLVPESRSDVGRVVAGVCAAILCVLVILGRL